MIDYGKSAIRNSALTEFGRIKAEPDSTIRYPYIIGVVLALLSEDPEMCEAIHAAFNGPPIEAGGR